MNENNNVVKTKNSKVMIVLVIILLIAVIGLAGLIIYNKLDSNTSDEKIDVENKETTTESDDKIEEDDTKNYNYSDLSGVYTFIIEDVNNLDNGQFHILQLEENGLFIYDEFNIATTGYIGNYTIVDDEIHLNYLFEHRSDIGLPVTSGSKILKINSEKEIIDNNPNTNVTTEEKVILTKNESYEKEDIKHIFENYDLSNKNTKY